MGYYQNKKILVTGGAGFIGSNLTRALLREGAQITILEDYSAHNQYIDYHEGINVYNDTVVDIHTVRNIIAQDKIDIIFHLAARNIISSTRNPVADYHVNVGGTLNILMAAREYNISRVIYTSSASVYGNPKYLPINEDDSINLLTPYATSKYAGEGYCMAFHESFGVPVTVLRLSNVYGPWQLTSNPYCGVVAKFMESARKGNPIVIHGDGLSTRDYTYVDDVVDALLLAGSSERAIGEVFNVATGIETSVRDLAKLIIDIYFKKYVIFQPETTFIDRRDIDNIRRRSLNVEKIRRKLGWMPSYTLNNGIEKTAEWTRDYEQSH